VTRILIVEDEPLIALDLAEIVAAGGFEVVGPALDVATALRLLDAPSCEAAVLDVNLGRETSAPIAAALRQSGIPFLVVSGYSRTQRPKDFAAAPVLSKPANSAALIAMLNGLTDRC
jgi:DNA-binding response OmpR family regulator